MTGTLLSQLACLAPLTGLALLLVLWTIRALASGFTFVLPTFLRRFTFAALNRVLRLFPPRGQSTRAISWTFLFFTLLVLLVLPATPDAWSQRAPDAPLALDAPRWLVAVTITIVALASAITAWENEVRPSFWGGLLLMLACTLAAVASHHALLTLVALDAAALLAGLLLFVYSSPELHPFEGQLLSALRRWLFLTLLASVLSWTAISFWSLSFSPALLTAGLLLRCAVVPFHTPFLSVHQKSSTPAAMLLAGALLPASMSAALHLLPSLSTPISLLLTLGAAWAWCVSTRQTDLRRATGLWITAAACSALPFAFLATTADSSADDLHDMVGHLLITALAAGATMATFLSGVLSRDAGHRDISRLTGYAARMPGAFGWIIASALVLAGGPPFASFAAHLLASPTSTSPTSTSTAASVLSAPTLLLLALGWTLGAGCALSTIHRVFLGLPRFDDPPIDLTARQRLVLLLLAACSIGGSIAPATLLRNPPLPTATQSP